MPLGALAQDQEPGGAGGEALGTRRDRATPAIGCRPRRPRSAREFEEFGYRETDDPDDADRRRFYKVEKWDAAEMHVGALPHASNDLSRAQAIFAVETARGRRGVAVTDAKIYVDAG